MIRLVPVLIAALAVLLPAFQAEAGPSSCTVGRVIDGDTFVCTNDVHVRMLQINTPESNECGGAWATSALANIFLKPGTEVRLEYDAVTTDRYGRTLAAPIVRGTDGSDYNISIVMVYVSLAKAAYYGDNAKYLDWANNSETWARNAGLEHVEAERPVQRWVGLWWRTTGSTTAGTGHGRQLPHVVSGLLYPTSAAGSRLPRRRSEELHSVAA